MNENGAHKFIMNLKCDHKALTAIEFALSTGFSLFNEKFINSK